MTFWRDRLSWLLLAFAIACFVVAAFPQWSDWVDPTNGDKVSERRHGLWFSPVYQHVHRVPPQGGFTTRDEINWLSWSSLVVLIGFGSWELLRWRRNKIAAHPRQQREIQAEQ